MPWDSQTVEPRMALADGPTGTKESPAQTRPVESDDQVPAILVEGLQKSYKGVPALKGVSFRMRQGTIFGLLGPNASGKTTTLRCITTLMQPDAGRVEILGLPVTNENIRQIREQIAYVAQDFGVDKVLTGREHMKLIAGLYHLNRTERDTRIEEVVRMLDFGAFVDMRTGTYSGGIRKRLDIALGLLHKPRVLILDEPTVGLDIESRQAIWKLLNNLRKDGVSILLTSHYLEEVDALADELVILDSGEVIAEGTSSQLKDSLGGNRITLRIREFTPAEEAELVAAHLQSLPGIRKVIVNVMQFNSLNLIVEPDNTTLSRVEAAVAELDLPIFSIAQSRPSLDDVYLAKTGAFLAEVDSANEAKRDYKKEKK